MRRAEGRSRVIRAFGEVSENGPNARKESVDQYDVAAQSRRRRQRNRYPGIGRYAANKARWDYLAHIVLVDSIETAVLRKRDGHLP
jgi:hypothetical protein